MVGTGVATGAGGGITAGIGVLNASYKEQTSLYPFKAADSIAEDLY
jgi:hypothetical protein